MKVKFNLITLIIVFSSLFSSSIENFFASEFFSGKASILFYNDELIIESRDGYDYISENKNSTIDNGLPALPIYSFSYGINPNKEYTVEFNIISSHIINDINVYPYQSPKTKETNEILEVHNSFYDSDSDSDSEYPLNNISHERSVVRGNEMLTVSLVPFDFMPNSKELLVYDEVEITIEETIDRESPPLIEKKSRIFQNIYDNMVLDTFHNREIDFQQPSILYICGGSSINYDSMDDLIDWRRKQGYQVTAVSLSQTGSSANSIENYIENAYENWENPPEFICIIGDVNGSITVPTHTVGGGGGWAGAYAESDLPYVLVDGNDILADMTIGRISVRSESELNTVVSKIIGYEKLYAGSDWLESVALVGDPYDSGISTVITNEYIAMIMENYGVEDINEQYSGSNSFDNFMVNQLNEGVSFLNYRGFYGFSGFNSNDVDQLSNGYKLPFLTTLTCDTGSFATYTTAICEELLKAGSPSDPKGAVAVVATAQPYTHTAFNNIVTMGMYSGIFLYEAKTAGEALTYGELALYETYPQNPNNNVYYFSAWNNLMGDPATMLWTDTPRILVADHLIDVSASDDIIDIFVMDENGEPVEGANVNITNNSNLYTNSLSDINGHAYLPLSGFEGSVDVTVTCQDCYFSETSFNINSTMMPELLSSSISIVSDDGILSPGEEVEVTFDINNNTPTNFNNLDISIHSSNSEVVSSIYNLLSLGVSESANISLDLSLPNDILPDTEPIFYLKISGNENSYQIFDLEVFSGSTAINSINIEEPNQASNIQIQLNNTGELDFIDITGEIIYNGTELDFPDLELYWNTSNQGSTSNSNLIDISVSDHVINGSVFNVPILITSGNSTYEQIVNLQITAGITSVHDPLGPDSYGYYIYDISDTGYDLAPVYDWVEISDIGYSLNFNDNGNNQDVSSTFPLPFTFTFYGIDYNQITVCSNGWISFGESDMESFRNYPIPGTGGPSPMLAAFWDDLEDGEAYYFNDLENNRFIIQWDDYELYYDNDYHETFQVILYNTDSEVMSGDDEILLQYKEFNNESEGDYPVGNYDGAVIHGQYASVGIEDHTGLLGLEYTFNNSYPTAASTLHDNSSLFISTRANYEYLTGDLNQDFEINILDVIMIVNIVLDIEIANGYQEYVADINQDNTINILDIVLLVELILGL